MPSIIMWRMTQLFDLNMRIDLCKEEIDPVPFIQPLRVKFCYPFPETYALSSTDDPKHGKWSYTWML